MKKRLFLASLVCMMLMWNIASANTVTFSGKLRNYTATADTPVSRKNDDEDRFYVTLTDGTFKDGRNNSIFGGRARLASTGAAVSHYETMDTKTKYDFGYIKNMNANDRVFLRYKIDSESKTPYMNVWGRFTA